MHKNLLPIVVSSNREGDEPPTNSLLINELAAARKSAQDLHKKCQQLENVVKRKDEQISNLTSGSQTAQFSAGQRYASGIYEKRMRGIRDAVAKEFDRKLAAYKDATRSEMKALRRGGCPSVFMVSHAEPDGQTQPHVIMSYHTPTADEIRATCGYPEVGEIKCGPLIVPLVQPQTK